MSAIAAFAGAAAATNGHVGRMLDAAPHRGAHVALWTGAAVQLGVRSHNPDAVEARDGSAVAFTGRIDNLEEIAADVGAVREDGAASIVLRAFARWGDDFAAHLAGDFAFALWDGAQARLVCARDALGQRPLFHADTRTGAIVASEPQQLLAHPDCDTAIDEGIVAEFLTGRPVSVDQTVWRGVRRLRPAELLVCAKGGVRRRRYWDFDASRTIAYRREEEYDEHFRTLFDAAIACRTRSEAGVGIFLSGGLDSSSIAGAAALRASSGSGPALRTYSLTFPGLATDESGYIDAVVARWGLPSTRLEARPPRLDEITAEIARYRDLPAYPNGAILDPLRARAAQDVRVVLTGYGGDDWFTGSPLHTTDLLRQGRIVAALRQLRADAALPGRTYTMRGLARAAAVPLLPRGLRRVLRPIAGKRPSFPWIRPELAARVALADRLRQRPEPFGGTFVQQEIHGLLNSVQQTLGDELEERAAAWAGIDQRHPFNDRRLAEFGFALPESQRWAGAHTKVLMRRALRDVLPPRVSARDDKAEFTPTLVQAIEALGGETFLRDLRTAAAGWVDEAAITRTYREMHALYRRGDESYIRLADAVWSVAAVELWFGHAAR